MRVPGIVWEGVPIEQETPVLVGFIGDTVLVGRPPSLPNTEKIESPQADWSLMFWYVITVLYQSGFEL